MAVSAEMAVLEPRWSVGSGLDPIVVNDPADGSVLALLRPSELVQVDEAVSVAAAAQPGWAARSPAERGHFLRLIGDAIRARKTELTALESRENGKPLDQAESDVLACAAVFDLFASLIVAHRGENHITDFAIDTTSLVPYGVVGAIIPFNWPPIHTAGKLAPALAVGNAVVLKPGDQTPLSPTRICEIATDLLPDDVVHVVNGGVEQGQRLVANRNVGKVAFTGSPGAGKSIIKAAAENYTPTLMELGGKDCLIICEDAPLTEAVSWAVEGGFFNQGEACTAASRVIVHKAIHGQFMEKFNHAVTELRVGPGARPGVQVGPLVTKTQQQRVLAYISIGVKEGAKISAQAALPADPEIEGGYYVPPTVFDGVDPNMRIATEEIFGPVVSVLTFDNDEDAVAIANGTEFGLIAGVFSADTTRAIRIASSLKVGMTLINNYNRAILGSPFGGIKASGYGREHCAETLKEYGYTKLLRVPNGLNDIPRWPGAPAV